ncbi:MAG: hypothetical protein GXN96_06685 [Aquificae bacterium]|nr:hypothetical protein [Aquificota bacterium]
MKILPILLLAAFCSSCAFMVGAAAGGAAGYYIGKEGYKVKIEKEE